MIDLGIFFKKALSQVIDRIKLHKKGIYKYKKYFLLLKTVIAILR